MMAVLPGGRWGMGGYQPISYGPAVSTEFDGVKGPHPFDVHWKFAGQYTRIRAVALADDGDLLVSSGRGLMRYSGAPVDATPRLGRAWLVGETIEAEDFDDGPDGVAYHDRSPLNAFGVYRTSNVDIGFADDGYAVGQTQAGEWLRYTIDVPATGTYTINLRAANTAAGGRVRFELDGKPLTGLLAVPDTGGWHDWANVSAEDVRLPIGRHTLRLVFETPAANGAVGNVDSLRISPAPTQAPFGPFALGQPIQAEHFDTGGFSVAYFDDTPDTAGTLRPTEGVEIVKPPTGPTYVTLRTGEWTEYTLTLAQAGEYHLFVRARPVDERALPMLTVAGRALRPYSAKTDLALHLAGTWTLAAGAHTIRVSADDGITEVDSLTVVRRS
jgi:hypothetical protein